jgi:hypothetical protein
MGSLKANTRYEFENAVTRITGHQKSRYYWTSTRITGHHREEEKFEGEVYPTIANVWGLSEISLNEIIESMNSDKMGSVVAGILSVNL